VRRAIGINGSTAAELALRVMDALIIHRPIGYLEKIFLQKMQLFLHHEPQTGCDCVSTGECVDGDGTVTVWAQRLNFTPSAAVPSFI
jgi:hypothetical protein